MRFRSSHRNHPGAGQQATQDREASTNAHSDENPGMEDVQELLCQDWVALVRKGDHFIIFHHVAGNHLTFLPKSLRYRQKMISGPTIKSKCFTPHTSKHMLRTSKQMLHTSKQSKQIFKPHPVCPWRCRPWTLHHSRCPCMFWGCQLPLVEPANGWRRCRSTWGVSCKLRLKKNPYCLQSPACLQHELLSTL